MPGQGGHAGTEAPLGAGPAPSTLPLLDVAVIDRLAEELGDARAVARFLRSFVELLPDRVAAISATGEATALVDQSQSIAAAAQMAGAPRLAQRVAAIGDGARAGRLPQLAEVRGLRVEAEATGAHAAEALEVLAQEREEITVVLDDESGGHPRS